MIMEQLLRWLCFSNQELGAEDFGVGHGMGMAQLIEGNLKVNTNCGVDIKVKGKKIKEERQSNMIQGKMEIRRDNTTEREGWVHINGRKNSSQDIFLSAIYSENRP